MSRSNGLSLGWMVSLGLHGALFFILGHWWLPRVVAMKGAGEEYLAVELSFVESIPAFDPEPTIDPILPPEEIISTDNPQADPVSVPEPIKDPPQTEPRAKPEQKRAERKPVSPKPPQTVERGNVNEVEVSEILRQVKPRYPAAAIRAGHQGTVSLLLTIGENGTVKAVEIQRSSGREDCDSAAVEALTKWWRFRPKGNPYQRSINIHFKLE